VGADQGSGLVHTHKVTSANVHDVSVACELLTGEETAYGDSGYLGTEKRKDAIVRNKRGRKIRYGINRRPSQLRKLSKSGQYAARKTEHKKSSVRDGRACFWRSEGTFPIPKDAVPRSAKTDGQIEYDVCSGKLDSG